MATQIIREKLQSTLLKELKLSIADEKPHTNPYASDKATIIAETRRFTQSTIKPKECCETLVKILFLLVKGGTLTPHEYSDIFFSITRLFQSSDQQLRRMVYLVVKSLEVKDPEVFILTSSLTKDMNSSNDCYRANAMRVLSKIIDTSMANQIERCLKTAIVDKNPFVASSALLCGMHLWRTAPDVVKRWINEITESTNNKNPMVQFHAVALLYEVKKSDRLALQKVLGNLTTTDKSPYAECLVIRYAVRMLLTERGSPIQQHLLHYLRNCLSFQSEMVTLEAAKAFCTLAVALNSNGGDGTVFGQEILPATAALHILLTSMKSVYKFAAARQLSILAQCCPSAVAHYNSDLENLQTDSNGNIASLALTILLKTGHESNIDRLIKQITSFMNEASDSFKLDIIRAVKSLCLAYPAKHRTLMSVLSSGLSDEGNFEFKNEAVETIISLVTAIPDTLETGLMHLCDFIEDCEYPSLCIKILAFLGEKVRSTSSPSRYIRFILNRLILENAHVRAAGVDALTKICCKCPELTNDILNLLESCTADNDDEVRDRANLFYKAVENSLQKEDSDKTSDAGASTRTPSIENYLDVEVAYSLDALCDQLGQHINSNASSLFDISTVPTQSEAESAATGFTSAYESASGSVPGIHEKKGAMAPPLTVMLAGQKEAGTDLYNAVSSIVSADALGDLLVSGKLQLLTESEAEYTLAAQKHIFRNHLILEFVVTNTLATEVLENVGVKLTGWSTWSTAQCIPIKRLAYNTPQSCFVVLHREQVNFNNLNDKFEVTLHFVVKENDDDFGFEDEYQVERVTLSVGDYIAPCYLQMGQFKIRWDAYQSPDQEQIGKFGLQFKTLQAAVEGLIDTLNMTACDKTDVVDTSKNVHSLLLSGSFMKEVEVLCVAAVLMSPEHGCILKLTCRSKMPELATAIISCLE